MAWVLIALYPLAAFAGWHSWWWFLAVPPVIVFVHLFGVTLRSAEQLRKVGATEGADRFIGGGAVRAIVATAWNFVLYGVAFGLGFGAHALNSGPAL
jgi:hypothetical protein